MGKRGPKPKEKPAKDPAAVALGLRRWKGTTPKQRKRALRALLPLRWPK